MDLKGAFRWVLDMMTPSEASVVDTHQISHLALNRSDGWDQIHLYKTVMNQHVPNMHCGTAGPQGEKSSGDVSM